MIYLFVLLLSASANASFDLSSDISVRSYPSLSGGVSLSAGYNQTLWGTINPESPMYGMIRAELTGESSLVVHQYDGKITLYPISFMGLGVGRMQMQSDYSEFDYYDCDRTRCKGSLNKDYAFGKILLAYDAFVTSFKYEFSRNSYDDIDDKGLPVAEYGDITRVSSGDEMSTRRFYFLGYRLDKDVVGVITDRIKYHRSQQISEMNALIYNKKFEGYSATLGAGNIHTTHQAAGAIVFLKFSYKFIENTALF